jgi:hypothetical protein
MPKNKIRYNWVVHSAWPFIEVYKGVATEEYLAQIRIRGSHLPNMVITSSLG